MEENKKALENESNKHNDIITQNTRKESFLLYTEQKEIVDALSNEDAGKLFKAVYAYADGEEAQLEGMVKLAFIPIRQQIDRNNTKYNEFISKQRQNGQKGGRPKKEETQENPKNPSLFLKTQKSLNDNDNDNDNVNVNELKNRDINRSKKNKSFTVPTIQEVQNYISEIGSSVDAATFIDYYEANGWKVGKNPMKDFKATIRSWERRRKEQSQQQKGGEYVWNPNL